MKKLSYYDTHKEQMKAGVKKYYEKNKEKIKQKRKEYYKRDYVKKRQKAYMREYSQKNREILNNYHKDYFKNNPIGIKLKNRTNRIYHSALKELVKRHRKEFDNLKKQFYDKEKRL